MISLKNDSVAKSVDRTSWLALRIQSLARGRMVKGKTCHHLVLPWLGHLSKINISFLDLPFSVSFATFSDDELDNQSA